MYIYIYTYIYVYVCMYTYIFTQYTSVCEPNEKSPALSLKTQTVEFEGYAFLRFSGDGADVAQVCLLKLPPFGLR